jgi:hypothetical protein
MDCNSIAKMQFVKKLHDCTQTARCRAAVQFHIVESAKA